MYRLKTLKKLPTKEFRSHNRLSGSALTILAILLLASTSAHAQGSPFDTGFNALQTLFTGIQFTAPDKSLGVANRDLAVIETIHPYGRVTAALSDDRRIEFNTREHPHFDHGYAVTSHSSQGLTAERVLVHADTSVHPDLLNSRFAYVSVSRASHDAVVFTDDVAKLVPQLGADVSKTSALEIHQTSSIAQGIRLGL